MKAINRQPVGLWLDPEEYTHLSDIDGIPVYKNNFNPLEYAFFDGHTNQVIEFESEVGDKTEVIDQTIVEVVRQVKEYKEKRGDEPMIWDFSNHE